MFTVKLDRTQNALTIGYGGRVTPDEIQRCAEQVRSVLREMQPDFRLLVDLTELQSMDVSCSPLIGGIMEMCNAGGVAEVVRIIPDPTRDIGLQILSYFHYGDHVSVMTCATLDEARR